MSQIENKLDKILDLNKDQIDKLDEVKDDLSKVKDDLSEMSSQFKIHSFEDATRFANWEEKFNKEIEPVLKHVNEKIALGSWIKENQKLLIVLILALLVAFGIVKAEHLIDYAKTEQQDP